jgi:amino acid transporter
MLGKGRCSEMMKRKMTRRLIVLFSVSALASGALLILYHFVFADILPLAASEETQSVWRFEAAFLVTAVTWICGAVCLLSALGLGALLCHRSWKGVNYG